MAVETESSTLSPEDGLLLSFELEEEFSNRYTDDDQFYQEHLQKPLAGPPTVENWTTRPKRNFDYARRDDNREYRGGHRGGYRGGHRRDHDNRYRPYDRRDNRDNRDWNRNRDNRDRNRN